MPGRATDLDEQIAGFYLAAFETDPLDAITATLESMISGDMHLAFITTGEGQVILPGNLGRRYRDFLMCTMAAADSHPLIYQTGGRVAAISDVLDEGEWQRREMYQAARPFLSMEDSLGTDTCFSPARTLSTCIIRTARSFQENDRSLLQWMLPHFSTVLRLRPPGENPAGSLGIFSLSQLPDRSGELVDFIAGCLQCQGLRIEGRAAEAFADCRDWLKPPGRRAFLHGIPVAFRRFHFDGCSFSVACIPPTGQRPGTLVIETTGPKSISRQASLTAREREVSHWLCQGKSNEEIGTILGIRPGTVKRHLENLYAKLDVPNRASAVRAILTGRS